MTIESTSYECIFVPITNREYINTCTYIHLIVYHVHNCIDVLLLCAYYGAIRIICRLVQCINPWYGSTWSRRYHSYSRAHIESGPSTTRRRMFMFRYISHPWWQPPSRVDLLKRGFGTSDMSSGWAVVCTVSSLGTIRFHGLHCMRTLQHTHVPSL